MRRTLGWLLVGVILIGGGALSGYGSGVQLPPAEEEIAQMEKAFGCVTAFFAELITEMKDAVAALNAVDQDLKQRYNELATKLRYVERELSSLADVYAKVPGLQDKVNDLDSRLSDLRSTVTELRRTVDRQIERLDKRVDGVEYDISELKVGLSDGIEKLDAELSAEIAAVEDEIAKVVTQLYSLKEDFSQLSKQVADHEKRITKLEDMDLGSLHRRVLGLEQSAQALQIKIDNNRKKIEGVEATLGGFSDKLSDHDAAIGELEGRMATQEARVDELEGMVEDLDIPALRDALGTAQVLGIIGLLLGGGALVLTLLN